LPPDAAKGWSSETALTPHPSSPASQIVCYAQPAENSLTSPLVSLPAYTPELNPTERLWPTVKEGIANRSFETLDEMEATVCARCQKISAAPAQVAALTNYHWLPAA